MIVTPRRGMPGEGPKGEESTATCRCSSLRFIAAVSTATPCNRPDRPHPPGWGRRCISPCRPAVGMASRSTSSRAASTSAWASSWTCSSVAGIEHARLEQPLLEEPDANPARPGRAGPRWTKNGRTAGTPCASSMNGRRCRAAIVHRPADGVPAGDRVVAVDHFARDAERLAAVDDVLLAVLACRPTSRCPSRCW